MRKIWSICASSWSLLISTIETRSLGWYRNSLGGVSLHVSALDSIHVRDLLDQTARPPFPDSPRSVSSSGRGDGGSPAADDHHRDQHGRYDRRRWDGDAPGGDHRGQYQRGGGGCAGRHGRARHDRLRHPRPGRAYHRPDVGPADDHRSDLHRWLHATWLTPEYQRARPGGQRHAPDRAQWLGSRRRQWS